MSQESPEGRNETIAAAVTADEKWQVKLVAKKTGRSTSDLLREHSLGDLISWGKRLDDALTAAPSDPFDSVREGDVVDPEALRR